MRRLKWLGMVILAGMLLGGCVDPMYGGDPYSMAVYGAGLQTAADAQIRGTMQAAELERQGLAMAATATAGMWQLGATQTMSAAEMQATAQAGQARATEISQGQTATAGALSLTLTAEGLNSQATQHARQATAEAIGLQIEHEKERQAVLTFWANMLAAGRAVFGLALMGMVAMGLWWGVPYAASWMVELRSRRKPPIWETRDLGPVALLPDENGDLRAVVLREMYQQRPRLNLNSGGLTELEQIEPVRLSVGGVTAESAMPNGYSQLEREAMWLLRRSDPESDRLASDDRAGMRRHVWSRATDALQAAGLVRKEGGVGTFVVDGVCRDVLYKLETRQVQLTPPPQREAEEWDD